MLCGVAVLCMLCVCCCVAVLLLLCCCVAVYVCVLCVAVLSVVFLSHRFWCRQPMTTNVVLVPSPECHVPMFLCVYASMRDVFSVVACARFSVHVCVLLKQLQRR